MQTDVGTLVGRITETPPFVIDGDGRKEGKELERKVLFAFGPS